jgi:hypothetical protein
VEEKEKRTVCNSILFILESPHIPKMYDEAPDEHSPLEDLLKQESDIGGIESLTEVVRDTRLPDDETPRVIQKLKEIWKGLESSAGKHFMDKYTEELDSRPGDGPFFLTIQLHIARHSQKLHCEEADEVMHASGALFALHTVLVHYSSSLTMLEKQSISFCLKHCAKFYTQTCHEFHARTNLYLMELFSSSSDTESDENMN